MLPESFLSRHRKIFFFLGSSFCYFIFFIFSVLVKKHHFNQFDFDMTVKIQDNIAPKLDKVFPLFSTLASLEGATLLLIVLLIFRQQIFRGFLILAIFLSAHIVELFGKVYINHPPPPFMFYKHSESLSFNFDKYYVQTGNSYPSGHSFRTIFIALIFIYTLFHWKKLSSFWKLFFTSGAILFVCLVGISRVALGEHWTSDVLGGGLFGIATALFTYIFI